MRADSVRLAQPLFQAASGGSLPTSALQLRLWVIDLPLAKQLNKLWHSRLPALTSPQCRVSYAAEFDGIYYASAVWSRPIARNLPQYEWLELQRLAIASDAPKNTASILLAVMTKLVRKRFPEITRLVSYQDVDVHTGCTYRAAGWKPTVLTNGAEWSNNVRCRRKSQSVSDKQRWEREIRPCPYS